MADLRIVFLLAALTASLPAAAACDLSASDAERAGTDCETAWMNARLHLNDLQAIGTHNSYKAAIPPDELAAHRKRDPTGADTLDFAHGPLALQLDQGMRALEFDVYYDPEGGRYARPPTALRIDGGVSPWLPAVAKAMQRPGFKVMHLNDIDFRSQCQPFVECLQIIRTWSRAHPDHAPVLITLNAKDGESGPGGAAPLKFDAKAFDALDAEIRSVFAAEELVVPDTVQGDAPTLREAVRAGRWPTLSQSRGKVLFALDEGPDKVAIYRGKRRSLEGRAMFVRTDEDSPAAAVLILNDPIAQRERIERAVRDGYLVRTRADAETREARNGDTQRREAAFASGAHYISTDYPQPDLRFSRYRVVFPRGEVARCNPLRDPKRCDQRPVEAADKGD